MNFTLSVQTRAPSSPTPSGGNFQQTTGEIDGLRPFGLQMPHKTGEHATSRAAPRLALCWVSARPRRMVKKLNRIKVGGQDDSRRLHYCFQLATNSLPP